MEKTNRNIIRRDTSGFKSLLREKGITIDEISHEAAASTGKSHNTINGHIKGYGLSKSISAEEIQAFSEILKTPIETIRELLGDNVQDADKKTSEPVTKTKRTENMNKWCMNNEVEWYKADPERMESARRDAGIPRTAVEASVNKNHSYYWKWMQGTKLRASAAQTIAELLNVKIEEIFVPVSIKVETRHNNNDDEEKTLSKNAEKTFASLNAVFEETKTEPEMQEKALSKPSEWNVGIPGDSANQPSLLCVEAGNNTYYCVGKYDKTARNFVELSYNFNEGDAYKGLSAKTQIVGNVKCWKQI